MVVVNDRFHCSLKCNLLGVALTLLNISFAFPPFLSFLLLSFSEFHCHSTLIALAKGTFLFVT